MSYTSKYQPVTMEDYDSFTEVAKKQENTATLFESQIHKMNTMYKLPINNKPTLEVGELASIRITKFIRTLNDEIIEGSEIYERLVQYEYIKAVHDSDFGTNDIDQHNMDLNLADMQTELLTDLADWFADVIVYCRSEAMKFGLPLENVLSIIMASNYSKLNSDGSANYNSDGKVLKGTNFQPPEKYIKYALLEKKI